MRVRMWLMGLGIASLVLVGAIAATPLASTAQQGGTPVVGTPLLQPAIDLTRAQEIALEGQTGAAVVSVDLDGDDGVLTYDVELDNGMEVEVDATTGDVLRTDHDDRDDHDDDHEDDD